MRSDPSPEMSVIPALMLGWAVTGLLALHVNDGAYPERLS